MTDLPAGPPAPPPSGRPPGGDDDHRVVAGVAFRVAGLLGVDPLWVRLGFVALIPFGGLGVALYAAAWFVLGAGRRPGPAPWTWFVAAGAVMWLWAATSVSIDSTLAWIVVLGGAALALWQPRTEAVPPAVTEPSPAPGPATSTRDRAWTSRPRRLVRREPSIVGRVALGVALLVAAAGALVDHLNGGRLHPEQWLGAAAVICGVGLVVSAWRGRAWWLIVPAAMFAGSGWLAGHAARAGVDVFEWDDEYSFVSASTPAGARLHQHSVAGDVTVSVYGAPAGAGEDPVVVDARLGVGDITIDVDDEVTVEVRPDVHDGAVIVHDGAGLPRRVDGPVTLGPDRTPDVIVRAEVSRGDVEIRRGDIFSEDTVELFVPDPPEVPPLVGIDLSTVRELADGIRITSDGTVILPDSVAVLSPDDELWLRDGGAPSPDGVTYVVSESWGEFLVLPNQTVITPSGAVIDVAAIRAELEAATDDAVDATVTGES